MTLAPPPLPSDEELAEVRAGWDDPEHHAHLLARYAAEGKLTQLETIYRHIRDEDPSRRAVAEVQLDRTFRAELRSLPPERSITPRPPNRLRFLAIGLFCFSVVYVVLSIVQRL
jgi:hypothetical protein